MAPQRASGTLASPSAQALDQTITAAIGWLEAHQNADGYWQGALESNPSMEAEWVLAMHIIGVDDDPKYDGVVQSLLNRQRDDGSWENYRDAPAGDISTTVECYMALRVAGHTPDEEPLRRALAWIEAHGGVTRVRVFTKYWLAMLGEWPWDACPAIPPQIILLPKWLPFNIYQFSSWARGTVVPMTVLWADRPVVPLPAERRLDELFRNGRDIDYRLPRRRGWWSWEGLFLALDRGVRALYRAGVRPLLRTSIDACLAWILRRQEADGCWGGIQPPWIWALMALRHEGFSLDHPVMKAGLEAFDQPWWRYERDGATYLQACNSPVWDTVLTLCGIAECGPGAASDEALRKAVDWVVNEEVTIQGDWAETVPHTPPGGWSFEKENDFYPDVDDTAVAIMALLHHRELASDPARLDAAIGRAVTWIEAMQCRGGGWGAFDKDNDSQIVAKIPFSDFGETLDPPSVDVTCHVLEAFGMLGRDVSDPAVARAVAYVKAEQEPDGSWFGRWGTNYIYGTGAVLPALAAAGEDMSVFYVLKAADWVVEHQNPDGGWGESCASYMDDRMRGKGESTASQTAWAIMALLAVESERYDAAIRGGLQFLTSTQTDEGTWHEPQYTATGFPGYGVGQRIDLSQEHAAHDQGVELGRGFMINYNLYRHFFPLMAMGRARQELGLVVERDAAD